MLLLRLLLHCTAGVAFVGSSDVTLRLRPLSPALGFEVSGPVVEAVRSGRARALLRRAFAASHGLLVFRELEGWQKEDMLALSGIFGLVEHGDVDGSFETLLEGDDRVHVFSKVPSARVFDGDATGVGAGASSEAVDPASAAASSADPEQYDASTGQPSWHTDQSFREPPPRASAMFCVSTPADGSGATLFAGTIAAHAALPEAERARLRQLCAAHPNPNPNPNPNPYPIPNP